VLLSVNAALANGFAAVYNRPEKPYAKMHPEFRCIAAANTWGRGGDRRYCGRSPLDESTLDRFRLGTIEFDYDSDLEKQLCPDTELYEKLTGVRSIIEASRLERVVSTRYFVDAFDALRHGWSVKRIVNRLCSGWRTDEYAKVHELIVSCTDEPRGGE
jgi:MoxR-like ATPase